MDTLEGDEVEVPFTEWLLSSPYHSVLMGMLSAVITFAALVSTITYLRPSGHNAGKKGRPTSGPIALSKQSAGKDRNSFGILDSRRHIASNSKIRRTKMCHEMDRAGHSGGQCRLTNLKWPQTETINVLESENFRRTRTAAMRNSNPLSSPSRALSLSTDEETVSLEDAQIYPHLRNPTQVSGKHTYRHHVPITLPRTKELQTKDVSKLHLPEGAEIPNEGKEQKDKYHLAVSKPSSNQTHENLKREAKEDKHFKLIIPKNESFKLNITCVKLKPLEQKSFLDLKNSQLTKKATAGTIIDKSVQTKQKEDDLVVDNTHGKDEMSPATHSHHKFYQLRPSVKAVDRGSNVVADHFGKGDKEIKRHFRKRKKMPFRNRGSHSSVSIMSLVDDQPKGGNTKVIPRRSNTEHTSKDGGCFPVIKTSSRSLIANLKGRAITEDPEAPKIYCERQDLTAGGLSDNRQEEENRKTALPTGRNVTTQDDSRLNPRYDADQIFRRNTIEKGKHHQQKKSSTDSSSFTLSSGKEAERERENGQQHQTKRSKCLKKSRPKQASDGTSRRYRKPDRRSESKISNKARKHFILSNKHVQPNPPPIIPLPYNQPRAHSITYSSRSSVKNKHLKEFLAGTQVKEDECVFHRLQAKVEKRESALTQREASAHKSRLPAQELFGDSTNALLCSSSEEQVNNQYDSLVQHNWNMKQSCRQDRIIYRPCSAVAEALQNVPTFTLSRSNKEAGKLSKRYDKSAVSKSMQHDPRNGGQQQPADHVAKDRDEQQHVSIRDCSNELQILIKNTIREMQKYEISSSQSSSIRRTHMKSVYPQPNSTEQKETFSRGKFQEKLTPVKTLRSSRTAAEGKKNRHREQNGFNNLDGNSEYLNTVNIIRMPKYQSSTGESARDLIIYGVGDEIDREYKFSNNTRHITSQSRAENQRTSDFGHHKDYPLLKQQTKVIDRDNVLGKDSKYHNDHSNLKETNFQTKTNQLHSEAVDQCSQKLKENWKRSIYTGAGDVVKTSLREKQARDFTRQTTKFNGSTAPVAISQLTINTAKQNMPRANVLAHKSRKGNHQDLVFGDFQSKCQGQTNDTIASKGNVSSTNTRHRVDEMRVTDGRKWEKSPNKYKKQDNKFVAVLQSKLPKEAKVLKPDIPGSVGCSISYLLPNSHKNIASNKNETRDSPQTSEEHQTINLVESHSHARSKLQKSIHLNDGLKTCSFAHQDKTSTSDYVSNDDGIQAVSSLSCSIISSLAIENREDPLCLHCRNKESKSLKLGQFDHQRGACNVCKMNRHGISKVPKSLTGQRLDELSLGEKTTDESECRLENKTFQLKSGTPDASKPIKNKHLDQRCMFLNDDATTKEMKKVKKYFTEVPFTSHVSKMPKGYHFQNDLKKETLRRRLSGNYDKECIKKARREHRNLTPLVSERPNEIQESLPSQAACSVSILNSTTSSLLKRHQSHSSSGNNNNTSDSRCTTYSHQHKSKVKSVTPTYSASILSLPSSDSNDTITSWEMSKGDKKVKVTDILSEDSLQNDELYLACISCDTTPLNFKYQNDKDEKLEKVEKNVTKENINYNLPLVRHEENSPDDEIRCTTSTPGQFSTDALFDLIKSNDSSNSISTSETSYRNKYLSVGQSLTDDFRNILNFVERCNSLSSQNIEGLTQNTVPQETSGFHPRLVKSPNSTSRPYVVLPSLCPSHLGKRNSDKSHEVNFQFIGYSSGHETDMTTLISRSHFQDITSRSSSPFSESEKTEKTTSLNDITGKPFHRCSKHTPEESSVLIPKITKEYDTESVKPGTSLPEKKSDYRHVSLPSVHLESEQVSYMEIIPKAGRFQGLRLWEMSEMDIPEIVKSLRIREHFGNKSPGKRESYSLLSTPSSLFSAHVSNKVYHVSSFTSSQTSSQSLDKSNSSLSSVSFLSTKNENTYKIYTEPNTVILRKMETSTEKNKYKNICSPEFSEPQNLHSTSMSGQEKPTTITPEAPAFTNVNIVDTDQRQKQQENFFAGPPNIAKDKYDKVHRKKEQGLGRKHSVENQNIVISGKEHESSVKKSFSKKQQTSIVLEKNPSSHTENGNIRISQDSLSSTEDDYSVHASLSFEPAQQPYSSLQIKELRSVHDNPAQKDDRRKDIGANAPHNMTERLGQAEKNSFPHLRYDKESNNEPLPSFIPAVPETWTENVHLNNAKFDEGNTHEMLTDQSSKPILPKLQSFRSSKFNSRLSLNKKYINKRTASRLARKNFRGFLQNKWNNKIKGIFDDSMKSSPNIFSVNPTISFTKHENRCLQDQEKSIPMNGKLPVSSKDENKQFTKTSFDGSSKSIFKFKNVSGLADETEKREAFTTKDPSSQNTEALSSLKSKNMKLYSQRSPSFHCLFSVQESNKKKTKNVLELMPIAERSVSETKIPNAFAARTFTKNRIGIVPEESSTKAKEITTDTNTLLADAPKCHTDETNVESRPSIKNEKNEPAVPESTPGPVEILYAKHSQSFTKLKALMKAKRALRRHSKLPVPVQGKKNMIPEKRKPSKIPRLVKCSYNKAVETGGERDESDQIQTGAGMRPSDRRETQMKPSMMLNNEIAKSSTLHKKTKDLEPTRFLSTTKNSFEKDLPITCEAERLPPKNESVCVQTSSLSSQLFFSLLPYPAIFLCDVNQVMDKTEDHQTKAKQYAATSLRKQSAKEQLPPLNSLSSRFKKLSSRIPLASAKNKIVQTEPSRHFLSSKCIVTKEKTRIPVKKKSLLRQSNNDKDYTRTMKTPLYQALKSRVNVDKDAFKVHSKKIQTPSFAGFRHINEKQRKAYASSNDKAESRETLNEATAAKVRNRYVNQRTDSRVPVHVLDNPNSDVPWNISRAANVSNAKTPVKTNRKTLLSEKNKKEDVLRRPRERLRTFNDDSNDVGIHRNNINWRRDKRALFRETEPMWGQREPQRKQASFDSRSAPSISPTLAVRKIKKAKAQPRVRGIIEDDDKEMKNIKKPQFKGKGISRGNNLYVQGRSIQHKDKLDKGTPQNLKESFTKTRKNQGFVQAPKHMFTKTNETPPVLVKKMQPLSFGSTKIMKPSVLRKVMKPQVKRLKNNTESRRGQKKHQSYQPVTDQSRSPATSSLAKVLKGKRSNMITRNGEKVCLYISCSFSSGTEEIVKLPSVTGSPCSPAVGLLSDYESSENKKQIYMNDPIKSCPHHEVKETSVKKDAPAAENHFPSPSEVSLGHSIFPVLNKCEDTICSTSRLSSPFHQNCNIANAGSIIMDIRESMKDEDVSVVSDDSDISSLKLNTTDDISASVIFGNPSPVYPIRTLPQTQNLHPLHPLQQRHHFYVPQKRMCKYQQARKMSSAQPKADDKHMIGQLVANSDLKTHEQDTQNQTRGQCNSTQGEPEQWPEYYHQTGFQRPKKDVHPLSHRQGRHQNYPLLTPNEIRSECRKIIQEIKLSR